MMCYLLILGKKEIKNAQHASFQP